MKNIRTTLGIVLALVATLAVSAQSKPLKFHKNPEYYLQTQSEYAFKLVDEALDAFPPVVGAPIERKIALYNLDILLHDTRNDNTEAFHSFITSRVTKLLADLEKPLKRGMRVYKIYNEAFIVRTKSVTIAFDISRCRCRGYNDPIIPTELAKKIVTKCDAMFLTHNHRDHVDSDIVDLFIAEGKPVVAAPEILADKVGVTHRRIEGEIDKFDLTLSNGKKLNVAICPSFQGKLQNNIYIVTTPDKYTACHTGDLINKKNTAWLAKVKTEVPQIDALIINCWAGRLGKAIADFDPRYVISGHENEMGHSIDHREAFWLSFVKLAEIPCDYVITAWGEWFSIK